MQTRGVLTDIAVADLSLQSAVRTYMAHPPLALRQ